MPIALLVAVAFQSGNATAPPFVDPLFSSNMVLQRDMADPIWGWTTPGATVTVSIADKTVRAYADSAGKWMTKLPKFGAGGSYTLSVSGPASASFSNVTFGDVWICSGQSNMEFGVGNLANPASEIADANFPDIRLCRIPKLIAAKTVPYVQSDWQVCTPDNLLHDGDWNGFSAVGYFFGKQLYQDLKVPIGLIHTSWGGTIAEAWTSEKRLQQDVPEFDPQIAKLKTDNSSTVPYEERVKMWYAANDSGTKSSPAWFDPSLDDSDWKTMAVPNYFQRVGIPELDNQASVVWLRKQFELPTDTDFTNATLHFVVDDNDATWVNGTPVGESDGYNVRRAYKIPAGVLHAGMNTVVVRVTDTASPGGLYDDGSGTYLDVPNRPQVSLVGDWKVKLSTKITDQNPFPVSTMNNPNQVTVLYNGMIYPLAPFGVKGAIWYQGESNVGRAAQYENLLPSMIRSWRETFGQGNFPFLIVQLAGFMHPPAQPGNDGWADLRDAQRIASEKSPNAGIATAIDIGNQDDIHPKNKEEVGRRLALVAEAKVYRKKIEYSGPTVRGIKIEGGAIRISFNHAAGLKTSDGQAPKAFAIRGMDGKWYWADAKIDGNTVVVSSPSVPQPVAVQYAWASFQDLNLQNGDGLPAFPFRI
jgi:sialate O-acetylesterase